MDLLENLEETHKLKTEAVKNFNSCYRGRIRRAFEIMEFIESKGDSCSRFSNWSFELWANEGPIIVMRGGSNSECCDSVEHYIECSELTYGWDTWSSRKQLEMDNIIIAKVLQENKYEAETEARERKEYLKLKAKFEGGE